MSTARSWFVVLVSLATGALRTIVLAQPPGPTGSEFQVNAYTTSHQSASAAAMAIDGDFVVVWTGGYDQDGSGSGVLARRFNAAGVAQGSRVPGQLLHDELPRSARRRHRRRRRLRRRLGERRPGRLDCRASSPGASTPPASLKAAEFQVNVLHDGPTEPASVGMDADGDFVVAWQSSDQDGSEYGVFARRFNAAGVAQAAEFQVNTYTTELAVASSRRHRMPTATSSSPGRATSRTAQHYGIFARRFNAAGVAQGGEFQVNAVHTEQPEFAPPWASTATATSSSSGAARPGRLLLRRLRPALQRRRRRPGRRIPGQHLHHGRPSTTLPWRWTRRRLRRRLAERRGQDGSATGVFARRFDAAGIAQGAEFQVNVYTTDNQFGPAVGMDGDGDFVVAWDSGPGRRRLRRLRPAVPDPAILDIDGNGSVAPLTDGLLVLRYLFGFTGATLITGAVDVAGCTRCNAPDDRGVPRHVDLSVGGSAPEGVATDRRLREPRARRSEIRRSDSAARSGRTAP